MPAWSHVEGVTSRNGRLHFSGVDLVSLAERFGTPLYVLSEDLVRDHCQRYRESLAAAGGTGTVAYAGKAFLTTGMCGLLRQEAMGLDVCSAGELFTAQSAGFPMDQVLFHGNGKTPAEIHRGIEAGVGRFVVDNLHELRLLNDIAAGLGHVQPIFFRVTPDVDTHTHEHVQTGHLDTKFGLGIANGQAEAAIRATRELPHVRLVGLHCHIGSQLFELPPFAAAIDLVLGFLDPLRSFFPEPWELDLGGGLGIPYTENDPSLAIEEFVTFLVRTTHAGAAARGLSVPRLWLEPGRSIVGSAGLTLYTVGAVKDIPHHRTFVAVDGSMADHPRTALYGSIYTAILANRPDERPADMVFAIAGKACESGDMIIQNAALPRPTAGDRLAVLCTGAYHYSMSSTYNRLPRPPVVGLAAGEARLLVRGETLPDLLRNDLNPFA